jgi:hypothetical protein
VELDFGELFSRAYAPHKHKTGPIFNMGKYVSWIAPW